MTSFMPPPPAATFLAFHPRDNNIIALGMEDSIIQIYNAKFEEWSPGDFLSVAISSAMYSCDGLQLFTGFLDSAVGVFDVDSLSLRCRIAPSAYISSSISSGNSNAYPYPVVIAAHPSDPTQFALGMSDGSVYVIVIEPSDGDSMWGPSDSKKNVALLSVPANVAVMSLPLGEV